jgi:hypothetical protein
MLVSLVTDALFLWKVSDLLYFLVFLRYIPLNSCHFLLEDLFHIIAQEIVYQTDLKSKNSNSI